MVYLISFIEFKYQKLKSMVYLLDIVTYSVIYLMVLEGRIRVVGLQDQ